MIDRYNFSKWIMSIGVLVTISGFWFASYLNVVIFILVLALNNSKIQFSGLLMVAMLTLPLIYKLWIEFFVFERMDGFDYYIKAIVYFVAFSYILIFRKILSIEGIVKFVAEWGWIVVLLNLVGIIVDLLGLNISIFSRSSFEDVGGVSGIGSGLNENSVSLAMIAICALVCNEEKKAVKRAITILGSVLGVLFFGSTIGFLVIVMVIFIFNKKIFIEVIFAMLMVGIIADEFLLEYRGNLGSEAFTQLGGLDFYVTKFTSDSRYALVSDAINLSLVDLQSFFLGYPKFSFNVHTGGNSFHSFIGELFSFGFMLGFILNVMLFIALLYALIIILFKKSVDKKVPIIYFSLYLLAFASSGSLMTFITPFILYLLMHLTSGVVRLSLRLN